MKKHPERLAISLYVSFPSLPTIISIYKRYISVMPTAAGILKTGPACPRISFRKKAGGAEPL